VSNIVSTSAVIDVWIHSVPIAGGGGGIGGNGGVGGFGASGAEGWGFSTEQTPSVRSPSSLTTYMFHPDPAVKFTNVSKSTYRVGLSKPNTNGVKCNSPKPVSSDESIIGEVTVYEHSPHARPIKVTTLRNIKTFSRIISLLIISYGL
jgi:hypothetical protein